MRGVEREEVLRLVVELLRAGGDCDVSVRDGRLRVELRLPAAGPTPEPTTAPPAPVAGENGPATVPLSEPERRAGRAAVALGGRRTREELAAACEPRQEPSSHFAALLSAMRRRGLLTGQVGEAGYAATPLLVASLDPSLDAPEPTPGSSP
jgi:hypothetical protein